MQEIKVESLGWEDPLEEKIATHPSIPAWKILWTEEPGRPQFTGSQSWTQLSVHTRAHTHVHTHTVCICYFIHFFFQHIFIEFQLCAVEIQRARGLDNS